MIIHEELYEQRRRLYPKYASATVNVDAAETPARTVQKILSVL